MKKLLLLILSMAMAVSALCAVGCSNEPTDDTSSSVSSEVPEEKIYTVTFKQSGQLDVVKEVKEGESLTDIPTPATKTGYTVGWEDKALTNITENIVVNAIEIANTYTVSYDLNGADGEITALKVTFDGAYVLATPSRDGYAFTGWTYEDKAVVTSGEKWSIASDVTLKANWVETKVDTYTVIFMQDSVALKTYTDIPSGTAFTNIPEPTAKTGYNVVWDSEALAKLESVTEDITVVAKETAKTYTVTLDANGGTLSPTSITVTYDEEYELPVPTREGYEFTGWTKGTAAFAEKGVWELDEENVTLKASWKLIETEEDQENEDKYWTNNY